MARTVLARQQLADSGLFPAYSPASTEGNSVENNGKIILHVVNNSTEDLEIKILSGYVKSGLKLADRLVTVPGGQSAFIGPLDPQIYNQPDTNQAYIDYSQSDGIAVAALLMP